MKNLVFAIALLITVQIASAQVKDEAFKKDVIKVMALNGGMSQFDPYKKQLLAMVPAAKQAAFITEFDASIPALMDKIADIYMENYTKEDIKAMLVFYESPVGKKIASKTPIITEKSMAVGQDWGQGLQTMMMKYMN